MTEGRMEPPLPGTDAGCRGSHLRPGDWVTHPDQPDWGLGQVQLAIGTRVTVTFEQAGKVIINAARVALCPVGR
jgi:hypothetical protein